MKKRWHLARVACLLLALLAAVSCGDKPDVYSVSIPNLKAGPDASVVAVEIDVRAGSVKGVPYVPIGWDVELENDPNWTCRIKATSLVSAASLSPDELKRFVLLIRPAEGPNFTFDVSGLVSVSKAFESHKIKLDMKDFSLNGSSE